MKIAIVVQGTLLYLILADIFQTLKKLFRVVP